MEVTTVNGLPAHPLIVHVVVVLVPLAALLLVLAAGLPSFARRTGVALPLLALVAVVCVPLATNAGEWLEERVPESAALEHHAELGEGLLPWALALLALAVGVWWLDRRATRAAPAGQEHGGSRSAVLWRVVPVVLALAVGVGAVVETYRIGDSGARAVWQDRLRTTGG